MSETTGMSRQETSRRRLRLVLALFLVIAAAVSVSVTTQHSALAAGCTAVHESDGWHVPDGCYSVPIKAAHHCAPVGASKDGKTQAIECADVYVTNPPGEQTTEEMWGVGTFYCQGVHPQCLGMNVSVWVSLSKNIGPAFTGDGTYQCGGKSKPCPVKEGKSTGKEIRSTSHEPVTQECSQVYAFDAADGYRGSHNVISVNGASAASHVAHEIDSLPKSLTVCVD